MAGVQVGLASPGDSRLQAARGGEGTNLETGNTPAGGDAYSQPHTLCQAHLRVGIPAWHSA